MKNLRIYFKTVAISMSVCVGFLSVQTIKAFQPPNKLKGKTVAYTDTVMLRNDAQMIALQDDSIYYITVNHPSKLNLKDGTKIEINSPGIYQLCLKGKHPDIQAFDPTHSQMVMRLKINENSYDLLTDSVGKSTFEVPSPLTFADGTRVKTVKDWETRRRPELLKLFTEQMCGEFPKGKVDIRHTLVAYSDTLLHNKAIIKKVEFVFSGNGEQIRDTLIMCLPKNVKGKVPVFLGLNWKNAPVDMSVVKRLIDAGYGYAVIDYWPLFPDNKRGYDKSILSLLGKGSVDSLADNQCRAIGTWAWGLSRVMDYFETDNQIDEKKVILYGHSRLGKTALWAGASDQRFAIVILNDSGCGGAALTKRLRPGSETLTLMTGSLPYWFCGNYNNYRNKEASLPFDQNELISLIAPRPVYVASDADNVWIEPQGEFVSCLLASPVYQLYGYKVFDSNLIPPYKHPIMNRNAYHIRKGGHAILPYDWECFIEFADKWLK